MERNFMYLCIVGALCFTVFVVSCSYEDHQCKVEAIKSGQKGDEVAKACRN